MNRFHNKISVSHQQRRALVYVRQSSLYQVYNHQASTERQYELVEYACQRGWHREQVEIIDQDLGLSGVTSQHRSGFQQLIGEVSLGEVGAVFCIEASRLSRANSDWHRLLEICALTDTLVIDEDGVYDPKQYNDRLLLGIKGTMSEAELYLQQQRLQGGLWHQAQKGLLKFRLPTGYVHDALNRIVLDPDDSVRSTIELVFKLFEQEGTIRRVVSHFREHKLDIPTRGWGHEHHQEIVWNRLSTVRAREILRSPIYAGAYVYGRTQTNKALPAGPTRRKDRREHLSQDEWRVFIPENHDGYITWETYERNLETIRQNRSSLTANSKGAAREGHALLQGIVVCGKCGRRMSTGYTETGHPRYQCSQAIKWGEPHCQTASGRAIDDAVATALLQALHPAQVKIALETASYVEAQQAQEREQWEKRIASAQYEAHLAKRRYQAVDPDHRLVAQTLEADWNDKLGEMIRVERDYVQFCETQAVDLSDDERQQIEQLPAELATIWSASTTSANQRKQLLRCLIADVVLERQPDTVTILIRWQTGAVTPLQVPALKRAGEQIKTQTQIIERIRELARDHTDVRIAEVLNREGYVPSKAQAFHAKQVKLLRRQYDIPTECPAAQYRISDQPRGDGRYSSRAVAKMLNVHSSTVKAWCQKGKLDWVRDQPRGPYWIHITPEEVDTLRKPEKRQWTNARWDAQKNNENNL